MGEQGEAGGNGLLREKKQAVNQVGSDTSVTPASINWAASDYFQQAFQNGLKVYRIVMALPCKNRRRSPVGINDSLGVARLGETPADGLDLEQPTSENHFHE